MSHVKLYHHKTDGGAEYLTDKFIEWSHNGKSGKEGIFEGANLVVRLDGEAELTIRNNILAAAAALVNACTPTDAQPNQRGEIRSVRTPEWEIVERARSALAEVETVATKGE